MRKILLTLLLLHASYTIAEPRMTLVPYVPVIGDELTMADEKMCEKRARIAAKSLQNAQIGITIEEQLRVWDEFILSDDAGKFEKEDLDKMRLSILLAWTIVDTHPNLTPNGYGDIVYDSCASEKLEKKVKI